VTVNDWAVYVWTMGVPPFNGVSVTVLVGTPEA
jgi:hypothetical protein